MSGKVAVVTGGAGSIGEAIIEKLVEDGYKCVCLDADAAGVERLAARFGSDALFALSTDLTDEGEVSCSFNAIVERWGSVDSLVNTVGIIGSTTPIAGLSTDEFDLVFRVNVRSCFLTMRAALRQFHAQQTAGSIVNLSSIAAHRVRGGRGLYAMTKTSIEAMTIAAAAENFDRGIRVNCVAPGPIDSKMYRTMIAEGPKGKQAGGIGSAPLGQPADVANMVAFLLSDNARHCTGHTFFVDGGLAS